MSTGMSRGGAARAGCYLLRLSCEMILKEGKLGVSLDLRVELLVQVYNI